MYSNYSSRVLLSVEILSLIQAAARDANQLPTAGVTTTYICHRTFFRDTNAIACHFGPYTRPTTQLRGSGAGRPPSPPTRMRCFNTNVSRIIWYVEGSNIGQTRKSLCSRFGRNRTQAQKVFASACYHYAMRRLHANTFTGLSVSA